MKKLFLLSALLIFACSDDDTSNEENTNPSNEKLIESVVSSFRWCMLVLKSLQLSCYLCYNIHFL